MFPNFCVVCVTAAWKPRRHRASPTSRSGLSAFCVVSRRSVLAFISLAVACAPAGALAYVQDKQLESDLRRNEPGALERFPSKGFKRGAADFFKAHELYVVPDSVRAWCQDQTRGVLPPGCYVEFFLQGKGLKAARPGGDPCGRIARWYKPLGAGDYAPTPASFFARAIAEDRGESIEKAIYEEVDDLCR